MEKLLKILEQDLNIKKGKVDMDSISTEEFIIKAWGGLYNNYVDATITGTVSNGLTSLQYDAEALLMTTYDYKRPHSLSISRKRENNIVIDLDNVKNINISVSENDWVDIHLLLSEVESDYSKGYVSIVLRK